MSKYDHLDKDVLVRVVRLRWRVEDVATLTRKAKEAKRKSHALLEQAKSRVEQLIEPAIQR